MYFQIKHLVLWPRDERAPRVIDFKLGATNIISGASKTGKSAVIPIIDYCLCSGTCAIPVGVIREKCGWFGVVIATAEGEKLFARREPGDQRQTGDMFVLESETVEIPRSIPRKNSTADSAKEILNRLSGLSNLGMDPQSEGYAGKRTGFRDLMAFTFQPQNVVANPDVLYFKADTTEHREKLVSIFPYVLNAVTEQTLRDRWDLDQLQRQLRAKENALAAANDAVTVWMAEASSWLSSAKELGLLDAQDDLPVDWDATLATLQEVASTNHRAARPSIEAIEGVLHQLEELQSAEAKEARKLSQLRQRLLEIQRLIQSSLAHGEALSIQRERLAISSWIRERSTGLDEPLLAILPNAPEHLDSLCQALEGVELDIQSSTTISDRLDKERLRIRGLAESSIAELNDLRAQIRELERQSDAVRDEVYRADQTERYLGRLEQALKLYENTGEDTQLRSEVDRLKGSIETIRGRISEQQIRLKVQRALDRVEHIIGQIVPQLDAEWPDAAVKLILKDLTLKVINGPRDDYLWEIGSGANWLAYHVAVSLAFQRFFLETTGHPAPSFLVYDQPSQVYFPRAPRDANGDDPEWTDEDVVAVRKVFGAVSAETVAASGNLQVIVLDHADASVWGGIANIHLVDEWRGTKKLVPMDW